MDDLKLLKHQHLCITSIESDSDAYNKLCP